MVGGMTKKPFWIVTLAVVMLFAIVARFTDSKPLAEAIRFLQISIALAVSVAYSKEAWRASMTRELQASDLLTIGIFLSWSVSAILGIVLLLWRLSGQPSWLVNNDWVNLLMTMMTFSAALHLAAPGAIGGVIPRRNMVRIGIFAGLACLGGIAVVHSSATISMFVRAIRPFVEEPRNNYDAKPLPSTLLFKQRI